MSGRICWLPIIFYAVDFDHTHFLYLPDNDALDFAEYDFAVEVLLNWDSTTADPNGYQHIITKTQAIMGDGDTGWAITHRPDINDLKVHFSDGSPTMLTKSYLGLLTADTWHLVRIEFDRDSTAKLYIDGLLIDDTFDISTRAGSVSNANPLMVGKPEVANVHAAQHFTGQIGMIRLDGTPRLYDADGEGYYDTTRAIAYGDRWNLENYYRLKYGHPRGIGHYIAAWYFDHSLIDASAAALEFSHNFADGVVDYAGGWPTYPNYTFDINPMNAGGLEFGYVDLRTRGRTLDTTLKSYRSSGPDKQRRTLQFRTNSIEQVLALEGAYLTSAPVHYYDDGNAAYNMRGILMGAPQCREVFSTTAKQIWEVSLEIEEI